ADGQRRLAQIAVFLAEVIAHHAVDDERTVDAFRAGEGLATGEVAPLIRTDDAAGFQPFQIRREAPHDIGARRVGRTDLARLAGHLPDTRADTVHFVVIGPHALHHDAPVDVHNV